MRDLVETYKQMTEMTAEDVRDDIIDSLRTLADTQRPQNIRFVDGSSLVIDSVEGAAAVLSVYDKAPEARQRLIRKEIGTRSGLIQLLDTAVTSRGKY